MTPYGVKVSIVEPGAFNTGAFSRLNEGIMYSWAQTSQELKDDLGQKSLDAGSCTTFV